MVPHPRAEAKYSLPRPLLNEAQAFFAADLSALRVAFTDELRPLGVEALASASTLYLPASRFDPHSEEGRSLLAHELAHVVQARRGALAGAPAGYRLAFGPALEVQADRAARLFASGRHDAGARAARLFGPARPNRGVAEGVFQAKLIVNGAPYPNSAPDGRLVGNVLYEYMRDAPQTFYFKDVDMLVQRATDRLGLYKSAPQNFTSPDKWVYFEKVQSAGVAEFQKKPSVWRANVTVTTETGKTVRIPVFSSVKRHLIRSYLTNQERPRKAEVNNSIVKDEALFEECLREFAQIHADAIKQNLMIFGYEPRTIKHPNPKIAFVTDTTMLPNISYNTEPNGIHSFPDSGTAVRPLPTPQEFAAVNTFLLWFFRTEEHLVDGQTFDKVSLLSPGEIVAKQKIVEAREKKADDIEKGLDDFKQYAPPASLSGLNAADVAAELTRKFKAAPGKLKYPDNLLKILASNIHSLLVETGQIPAIAKPLGPATKKTGHGKKHYLPGAEIRFKTHKCEVKTHVAHLPKDLIAWLIDGYVQVDADTIIADINNSVLASKLTVQEQIAAAEQEVKPRTGKGSSLANVVEDFYKYYELGVQKNLFKTRLA